MWVLLQSLFRTMRANILHTASTVAGIAASFMLLMFSELMAYSCIESTGADGRGVLLFLIYCLSALILISPGYWLYISVMIEERKRQYHVLFSSGANNWQMLKCIAVEVFLVVIAGAIPGSAVGTVIAWAGMKGLTSVEGIRFCWDTGDVLRVIVAEILVVALSMVAYAAYILYRERWKSEVLYARKPVYRRTVLGKLLGIGAVLGAATCKQDEKNYTACMPALVASVCALLLLGSLYTIMNTFTPIESPAALTIHYTVDAEDDASLMSVLDEMTASGEIETPLVCRTYKPDVYCLLPEEHMSSSFVRTRDGWSLLGADTLGGNSCHSCRVQQTVGSADGNTAQKELLFPQILFYDDALFAQLCRENGVSDPNAEALLYNVGQTRGRRVPLLEDVPTEDMELVFYARMPDWEQSPGRVLPDDRNEAQKTESSSLLGRLDADEFLRSVHVVQKHTVRIAGLASDVSMHPQTLTEGSEKLQLQKWVLQSVPTGAKWGVPALILPERLRSAYTCLPDAETTVYLNPGSVSVLLDGKGDDTTLTRLLVEKLSSRFTVYETVLGVGSVVSGAASGKPPVYVIDCIRAAIGMDSLRQCIHTVYRAILTLFTLMLAANIVKIAHLNRIVRQREYALLEIVGIRHRQKISMLVYESLRYSVRSVLCSIPLSFVGLLAIYLFFASTAAEEKAAMLPTVTAFFGAGALSDSAAALTDTFRLCCGRIFSYSVYAFIILFVTHLLTNIILDLHMQHRTVLPVLKETPYK